MRRHAGATLRSPSDGMIKTGRGRSRVSKSSGRVRVSFQQVCWSLRDRQQRSPATVQCRSQGSHPGQPLAQLEPTPEAAQHSEAWAPSDATVARVRGKVEYRRGGCRGAGAALLSKGGLREPRSGRQSSADGVNGLIDSFLVFGCVGKLGAWRVPRYRHLPPAARPARTAVHASFVAYPRST